MKKYLLPILFLAALPVFALDMGGIKVNVPSSGSQNTSSTSPSETSNRPGQTAVRNSLTPQEQVIKDIKTWIKSKYEMDYRWVMTGNRQGLQSLIAAKYGQPKTVPNGVAWVVRPSGDTSGQCAKFSLTVFESSRIGYYVIVNETCH